MKHIPNYLRKTSKAAYVQLASTLPLRWLITSINKRRYLGKVDRKLEIGPGPERLPGFETFSVVPAKNVDYIGNATGKLPFADDTFSVLYASHVLEHIPWPIVVDVLREWVRVLRSGGSLEIWVPDGTKVCEAWLDYELRGNERWREDGWPKFNPDMDACRWANARLLRFGDGPGGDRETNWHHGFFSPRYLCKVLSEAGLKNVELMSRSEVRGFDHGWINLGAKGIKR